MRVLIINTSERIGGAAIAASRLMESLKNNGIKAKMLVRDKQTDQISVVRLKSNWLQVWKFMWERIVIWSANRFRRYHLFDVDIANTGTDITSLPEFRQADVIHLHWVNQGMLSLKDIRKILTSGKPVVWTMHDMWNMTGICHHAALCDRFSDECGCCPLLGHNGDENDLSRRVQLKKEHLYAISRGGTPAIHFVAVSNWLAERSRHSTLLRDKSVSVIPNAFPFAKGNVIRRVAEDGKFRILFGAARLDDPIKGLPVLLKALKVLCKRTPELGERSELVTFGAMKDREAFAGVSIPHRHLGVLHGEEAIRKAYSECDCVVSASSYETLPGTLVEGQAYGCVPVSFDRGGQRDIVDHKETGYIAEWNEDEDVAASRIADGLIWAANAAGEELRQRMETSARSRFSEGAVGAAYLDLFRELLQKT